MGIFIFIVVFIVLAVLAAVLGRSAGRHLRQGVGIGLMLLGLGAVVDPPQRHGTESVENDRDDAEAEKGEKK
jgi:galactitol-specific phosphotransferase system IIC component